MKISTKLTGLIGAAALVAAGMFAVLSYRSYDTLKDMEQVVAGSNFSGPLRDLGEGLYRHKMALLKGVVAANFERDTVTRNKDQIRKAMESLAAADRQLRA
jgi:hypothetical protein